MDTLPRELGQSPEHHATIVNHYAAVMPNLSKIFGPIPLVFTTFPRGLGNVRLITRCFDSAPATVPTIAFTCGGQTRHAPQLSESNANWLLHERFAVEFESWSPLAFSADHAAFVRLILTPMGAAGEDEVADVAHRVRSVLQRQGLDAIPLLDGLDGMSLWIPCADPRDEHVSTTAPSYPAVRAWAQGIARSIITDHPQLATDAALRGDRGDRVYIGVDTNTVGLSSSLPYSLRGVDHLPVCLPITWDELGKRQNGAITAENFDAYFAERGEIFAPQYDALRRQALPAVLEPTGKQIPVLADIHGEILTQGHTYPIDRVMRILGDGAEHTLDDLLQSGIAQKYFPPNLSHGNLYNALQQYVLRTVGNGRTPALVEHNEWNFRLNGPLDDWPSAIIAPGRSWLAPERVGNLAERLQLTAIDIDPTAFAQTVCEAFSALGFLGHPLAGTGQPDGMLDAPLGREGYRVVFACRTAAPNTPVKNARVDAPDGFRTQCKARYALLIGPLFRDDPAVDEQLQNHRVALWTVADLILALEAAIGPAELESAFAPGRASKALATVLWQREHGSRKRIAVIAERIARVTWYAQYAFGVNSPDTERPGLTIDALMLLLDQSLAEAGTLHGATSEEFQRALALVLADGTVHGDALNGYIAGSPPP